MNTRREADSAPNAPSAKFLQARITALSTSCIKRLENIFAAALDEDHSEFQRQPASVTVEKPPPSLTETAVKQLQLEVESTALVRAAEEFMVLTRGLKELWLFGGLNTLPQVTEEEVEKRRQMEADEVFVVQGFLDLMGQVDKSNQEPTNGTVGNS